MYKALLFMGAGAVEDAAGTRSLDRLGGLLRFMPYTGLFLLVGALAPTFFRAAADEAALPAEFTAEFHDLGAQVGGQILPGRGLVVLHRGGSSNPVVCAMSPTYMLVALAGLLLLTGAARVIHLAPIWERFGMPLEASGDTP